MSDKLSGYINVRLTPEELARVHEIAGSELRTFGNTLRVLLRLGLSEYNRRVAHGQQASLSLPEPRA